MKDQLMQKVTQVPSLPDLSETVLGVTPSTGETTDIGKERKNNKSAAMIGLAISMGASSVLLPGHTHQVMAATNTVQVVPLNSLSGNTEPLQEADKVQPEVVKLAPPEIKHTVKQGETLWELSKNYEIAPEKIASSNKLKGKVPLLVGQTVNIPVEEDSAQFSQNLSSQTVANASIPIQVQMPVGQSLPVRDNVDQLLQQPRQVQTPLVASQTNINRVNNPEAVSIRNTPSGNINPSQFPKLLPEQNKTLALGKYSGSSIPSSRIEQPKVIQQSGKPIPTPPPQVGMVPVAKTSQTNQNSEIALENNSTITNNTAPLRLPVSEANPDNSRPVVIPISPSDFNQSNNSNQSRQISSVPQVISPDRFSPIMPQNSNGLGNRQFYQVRSGDTLNSIARRYGISREELMRANGISNPNLIKVSQNLIIPSKPSTNPAYQTTSWNNRSVNVNTSPNYLNNNRSVQAANNTYLNNLRSEIGELRENAQNQLNNTSDGLSIPVVAQFNNIQPPTPVAINPEWQRNNYPQQTPQANYRNNSFAQPQVIGAVPIPVERYNPMLNPSNGQQVSPDIFSPNNNVPFTGYIWPAKGVFTSGYGWRWGRMHKGIDIAAPVGTPIMAAASGEVISAGWNSGGYGNLVKLRHSDGSVTLYAHNSRILVRRGQFVEQGQQISEMGSTGFSTGPHLHFEIHPNGQGATNPIAFLPPRNR